jgi:signal transduction histidine kinase
MAKYGMALIRKGEVLISLGQYDHAFQYFHEGKLLSEQHPDSCSFAARFNGELGDVSYKQRRFADAIVYYLAALDELSDCHSGNPFENFQAHQGQLDNIGLCYDERGLRDSALYYYRLALEYIAAGEKRFREPGQLGFIREARALVNGNMSNVFDELGDYTREEQAIRASMLPRGNLFDNGVLSLADLDIHHLGRFEDARQLLDQARSALDTQHIESTDELMWRRLQWQYLDTTGNIPAAYRAYRDYVHLHDSLLKAQQELGRVDMKKEFEAQERQEQLGLLRESNALERNYLFIALGFSILAVVIILLIWWNWRRSRRDLRVIGLHNKHLELTLETLEQRNRDYDHLFKMVAHDLRNPIAGISGITTLLGESERLTEEDRQMLALIHHSCAQLLGLIHELLESKANPESRKLSMSWCDMGSLLEECVSLLQIKAEEKRQTIKLSKVTASMVLVDRNKMWRVLNNLLTNAIKFSPEKSVIRVAASKRENSLLISVADSGIGIPEDMRPRIFDAFTGAGREGTQGEQSFGLGLSICRQIVEAHGGNIWFESDMGHGTTFFVTLPMPIIVEEPAIAP